MDFTPARRYTGLSDTELGGSLTLRPASLLDVLAQGSHEISTHGEHMCFRESEPQTADSGPQMLDLVSADVDFFLIIINDLCDWW